MSTAAMIGLGIFAWVLLSVLLALFVGRMIQLRDRQRPNRTPPVTLTPSYRACAASPRPRSGPDLPDEF